MIPISVWNSGQITCNDVRKATGTSLRNVSTFRCLSTGYDIRSLEITMLSKYRYLWIVLFVAVLLVFLRLPYSASQSPVQPLQTSLNADGIRFHWTNVPHKYPVKQLRPIPTAIPHNIPQIQYVFPRESRAERNVRGARLEAVKSNFTHAWKGYKDHAWLKDEVRPVSGQPHNPFGGWAATLVDSLGKADFW